MTDNYFTWTIEQYKFWKGLNKTCWARHPGMYTSDNWSNMFDIMREFEKVNPKGIYRVTLVSA